MERIRIVLPSVQRENWMGQMMGGQMKEYEGDAERTEKVGAGSHTAKTIWEGIFVK
jgi:hypothetical protein